MSPIVACSVASLYECKPNLKNDIFFKRLLYKPLGGRTTTETTGIILVCFDGKYVLQPIKNTKNLKSLLGNLLHHGPLKTTL